MRRILQRKVETFALSDSTQKYFIASVGLATFVFGFLAGAILNLYFLLIHSPLVSQFRASLDYKSSIFGDGVILPIINMFAAYFLLENRELINKKTWRNALAVGALITLYFHINQAARGLVNWAMPTPWNWNILGSFHAIYMLSVGTLVGLFFLTVIKYVRKNKSLPKEAVIVTIGAAIFLILLRLDYISVVFSLPKL